MSINLPQFLFVGTAKAGTTSIYRYLKQHPDLCIPLKETFFFLRNVYKDTRLEYPKQRKTHSLILSESKYDELYRDCSDKIAGEIGTGYLYYYDHCIPEIKQKLGADVKILIVLRDPAERAFSSFLHFRKDLFDNSSFEKSLEKEQFRIDHDWDFMWYHKRLGLYFEQVKSYKENFNHVKVLFYEHFQKDPRGFITEIFNFIGVDHNINLDLKTKFNPSGEPLIPWFQRLITHENVIKKIFRPIFKLFYNEQKRAALKKRLKSKNLRKGSAMSSSARNELIQYYKEDIQKLELLLDKDLSRWYL